MDRNLLSSMILFRQLQMEPKTAVLSLFRSAAWALAVSSLCAAGATASVVASQDWEGGFPIPPWSVDNGVWEVGVPTSGPGAAHQGTQCAATILDGNYPDKTDSRLIWNDLDLTSVSLGPGEQLRVFYWEWHALGWESASYHDDRRVEVRTGGGGWTGVGGPNTRSGGGWVRASVDLTAYAGQEIDLGFRLVQHDFDDRVAAGWYIDEVTVEIVPVTLDLTTGFESGWGYWWASNGIWQIGEPADGVGPGAARTGAGCAGTILAGNYPDKTDSRLISPKLDLRNASLATNERLRLYFWQWHAIGIESDSYYDSRSVQVRLIGGSWTTLNGAHVRSGSGWSRSMIDISAYVGEEIEVGFLLNQHDFDDRTAAGWYVDDVTLEVVEVPNTLNTSFEDGWGDWWSSNGIWQVGAPTSGPGAANSGTECAATRLDGNYADKTDTRLVSPVIDLTETSLTADEELRLYFWEWSSTGFESASYFDDRRVYARVEGESWTQVSATMTRVGNVWGRSSVDLSDYVGENVEVSFLLRQHNFDDRTSSGWYIDDVRLLVVRPTLDTTEGFELGWDDWWSENSIWEIGEPTSGPGSAYSGSRCAATVLAGNYADKTECRLVSPKVDLSDVEEGGQADLVFWEWYSLGYESASYYDAGYVQVRPVGGSWTNVGSRIIQNSGTWSPRLIDLSAFAGQVVEISFFLLQHDFDDRRSSGWYIDEVSVFGLPEVADAPDSPNIPSDVHELGGMGLQVWPNPVRGAGSLRLSLGHEDHLVVRLFDVMGREVDRLVDAPVPAGTHEWTWDAAALRGGVYYLRAETSRGVESRRVVRLD